MKKVVSLLCFVVALAMAENTIDLSNMPLSHEVEERKSKVGIDVGIGYIMSPFKAKQEVLGVDTTALMHGAEIFTNLNIHITERFGFSFGMGFEFVLGSFKDGLNECNYTAKGTLLTRIGTTMYYKRETTYEINEIRCNKNTDNWQLLNWYINTGIFVDALKFKKVTVRAFGNVGFSFDWFLKNGKVENEYSCWQSKQWAQPFECKTYNRENTVANQLIPISLGLRFIFADNHGVELVGKYYYVVGPNSGGGKWIFRQNLPIVIDTQFTRNFAFGLRYVYEFR